MKLRPATLWRVPVFCTAAGVVCFYATIYLGRFFFAVSTTGADGATHVSVDPVRSMLFQGALFVLLLLLGGLWAFRSMTRAEVVASAAIFTGLCLAQTLLQLCLPGVFNAIAPFCSYIMQWSGTVGSGLTKLGLPVLPAAVISHFTPFLFVLFPHKRAV